MYFKENEFYPMVRKKHYTNVEIFSFVGGLFGLFLGFSVLSLFELIFHFIIVPILEFFKKFQTHQEPKSKKAWRKEATPKTKAVKEYAIKIMENSSIHGLVYISDGSRRKVERYIHFNYDKLMINLDESSSFIQTEYYG